MRILAHDLFNILAATRGGAGKGRFDQCFPVRQTLAGPWGYPVWIFRTLRL